MCHSDSPAPPLGADVIGRRARTPGTDPVPYEVFETDQAGSAPWIVLVTDIYGINDFYRHLSTLLVRAGYRVAVPDLFHRVGPVRDGSREAAIERRGRLNDQQAFDDMQRVVEATVAPRADTEASPAFGSIGFCLRAKHFGGGGRLVALSWESVPTGESADRKVWRRLRANQLPAPANTVLPG